MQKLKMFSLISAAMLLTGCSITKINQTNELATGEVSTGAIDSGVISTDLSGNQVNMTGTEISGDIVNTTGETVTAQTGNAVQIGNTVEPSNVTGTDLQTSAEDNALKAKIKMLIEQRKLGSKSATGLTEDDIQLMTDVLKAIVDDTNKK